MGHEPAAARSDATGAAVPLFARLAWAALLVLAGTQLGCSSDVECVAGTSGCPCLAASTCGQGLTCEPTSGLCESAKMLRLPAIDPSARSCELLLEDDQATVVHTVFDPSVRGEEVREAPRTGIAFHAMGDAAIGPDAVKVLVLGDGPFRIASSQCFDREGRPIAGGGMSSDG
jgi:hypothetical protein